jgi:hypothetical protein
MPKAVGDWFRSAPSMHVPTPIIVLAIAATAIVVIRRHGAHRYAQGYIDATAYRVAGVRRSGTPAHV